MTNKEYADILIPNVKNEWDFYENKYIERDLGDNAYVSRFAPSPTGSMHIGNIFSALTSYWYSKQSNGKYILRIEDTDQKRQIDNGISIIIDTLKELDVNFDEGPHLDGNYGPYIQSEREDIYKAYAKKLIEEDLAYPCFCTPDDLTIIRENQEKKKMRIGYYGKFATCRNLSQEDVIEKINNNEQYIIRFKSPGSFYNKIVLDDLIRGNIELPEHDRDEVIIKGDGLPTYHFAHVIDDHLMRTNLVIRGDEWISSYPIHYQLFNSLNFKLPRYAHISPINIKDGETTRKISKRKDPWASVSYYNEAGIPNDVIKLYLATLLNSNFEEWFNSTDSKNIEDFTFNFDKMSITGPVFDMEKLLNISKTYFSRLKASDIYDKLLIYTEKYDVEFYNIIKDKKEYTINLLNIEREVPKPRKDISSYKDIKEIFWYMYDELFDVNNDEYEILEIINKDDLINYFNEIYKEYVNQEEWFNELAIYANTVGYTNDRKAYKANPEEFKGTTADFCKILRIIITKKNISPNLFDIINLLGKEKLIEKINIYFK